MNNSKIAFDEVSLSLEEPVDNTEHLRERESQIIRILEAIAVIRTSEAWITLRSLIFDNTVESLEKRLKTEAEKLEINQPEINHLQGQLLWARKYVDLDKLASSFKVELSNIRKLTQPTER